MEIKEFQVVKILGLEPISTMIAWETIKLAYDQIGYKLEEIDHVLDEIRMTTSELAGVSKTRSYVNLQVQFLLDPVPDIMTRLKQEFDQATVIESFALSTSLGISAEILAAFDGVPAVTNDLIDKLIILYSKAVKIVVTENVTKYKHRLERLKAIDSLIKKEIINANDSE